MREKSAGELSRGLIVKTAMKWLDTPYQHQSSVKGAGCDCLGLIRGVWRELYGHEPAPVPPYSIDWAETGGEETLLKAAQTYLHPCDISKTRPGDILMFRMQPHAMCKHVAILITPNSMLHAYWGRAVVESALIPYWRRRWVHSFTFPEMDI